MTAAQPVQPAHSAQPAQPVLSVRDLVVAFDTPQGRMTAVDGVSFDLYPDEVLAIVGESGSGKSVTMLAAMGLLPQEAEVVSGSVAFRGREVIGQSSAQWRQMRGRDMAMVFQDPMTSLNPVMRIGTQLRKAIAQHATGLSRSQIRDRAVELLRLVRIPNAEQQLSCYPHQFSGGMRQRVIIAMAMAHRPPVLIADEPTTALDVTIQAQVLDVLSRIRAEEASSMVLITHDLGVVAEVADRVVVMYGGTVMETGTVEEIFDRPHHPYTKGLLASSLSVADPDEPVRGIPGAPPRLGHRPGGCVFHPRCDVGRGRAACSDDVPTLGARTGSEGISSRHLSACHFADELDATRATLALGTSLRKQDHVG